MEKSRQPSDELVGTADHMGCGVQHSLQFVGCRFRRTRHSTGARQDCSNCWILTGTYPKNSVVPLSTFCSVTLNLGSVPHMWNPAPRSIGLSPKPIPVCHSAWLTCRMNSLGRTMHVQTSSDLADRPRDVSCLSVVTFNGKIPWVQSFIISYLRLGLN